MLLHELGQRFDSPTVNLYFSAGDFVKFCADMKYYFECELEEFADSGRGYPVGTLGSGDDRIIIYFMHYDNFSQAKGKWDERKKRIHWDNIYYVMTDGTNSSDEIVRQFDSLPLKHKAVLTGKEYSNVESAVRFPKLGNEDVGQPNLFAFKSFFSFKRVIDDWDYVSFLNTR